MKNKKFVAFSAITICLFAVSAIAFFIDYTVSAIIFLGAGTSFLCLAAKYFPKKNRKDDSKQ